MEDSLSGTLAIDLGNTNTVVAFQDQKDINCLLYTSDAADES